MSKAGYVNKSVSATWVHDEASPGLKRVTLKAQPGAAFDLSGITKQKIARALAFPMKGGDVSLVSLAVVGETQVAVGPRDVKAEILAGDPATPAAGANDIDGYGLYVEYF